MDLKAYYDDFRTASLELKSKHPDGVVHVTSLFHRERGSTEGHTASANIANAARVITDGTHREATEPEIQGFYDRQRKELQKNFKSEQLKKQQYVVVTDQSSAMDPNATIIPGTRTRETTEPSPAVKSAVSTLASQNNED